MKKFQRSERGQALVLIVLTIVGAIGFAALAIYGGMIYAERRRAQNAADAAAYAAALVRARQQPSDNNAAKLVEAENAAIAQANNNGFSTLGTTTVEYHHPPVAPSRYAGNASYYQVIISSDVQPIFSQFVFSGRIRYTVEALAKARVLSSITPGSAIFATSPDHNACRPALKFSGSGDLIVRGANVFSNSNATSGVQGTNCYSGTNSLSNGGSITVRDGTIQVAGEWHESGNGGTVSLGTGTTSTTDNVVQQGLTQQQLPSMPTPVCPTGAVKTIPNKGSRSDPYFIDPGNYSGISWGGGDGTLYLRPGIYCLSGDFAVNGGAVYTYDSNPGAAPMEGVMIYLKSGDFDITGGTVKMNRADNLLDSANQQWGGMFLYMPMGNKGVVKIGGNSNMAFSGTFFAPDETTQNNQEKCNLGGGGSNKGGGVDATGGNVVLSSQFICHSLQVTGTSNLEINYVEDQNYRIPPAVEGIN